MAECRSPKPKITVRVCASPFSGFKFWRRIVVSLALFYFVFSVLGSNGVSKAADFEVIGTLSVAELEASEVSLNLLHVFAYRIGDENIWEGTLQNDQNQLTYEVPINALILNDQLVVVVEGENLGIKMFGGTTTVVTDKDMQNGTIGPLQIDINEIPQPKFETTDSEILKICWPSMDDFSVVGYEVFRTDLADAETLVEIGRSGQSVGRPACFLDSVAEANVAYYYAIAPITSWNAGETKQVRVSSALSGISNGIELNKGVVKIINEPTTKPAETDLSAVVNSGTDDAIYQRSLIGRVFKAIKVEIDNRGLSLPLVLIYTMAVVLIILILIFVLSIGLANVRSSASGVWNSSKK